MVEELANGMSLKRSNLRLPVYRHGRVLQP